MKKNRGFSLVELSIVLVIIGTLTGLTLKVMNIVNAARLKQELSAAAAISTAFQGFEARFGRLPGDNNNRGTLLIADGTNARQQIINAGFLNDSDFRVNSAGRTGTGVTVNNLMWNVVSCYAVDRANEGFTYPAQINRGANLCLIVVNLAGINDEPTDNNVIAVMQHVGGFELMMDDKQIYKGSGRAGPGGNNAYWGKLNSKELQKLLSDKTLRASGGNVANTYSVIIR